MQVVTGICLATVYVPSADGAWQSLEVLNYEQPLGWFLRAVHGWGSNFMVALMSVHLIQVFLFGAYKYPRELTWIAGVFLLLCTLGMAFTGQVLRFDQDAYWGLGIGVAIAGRAPFIGREVVHLILGGPIIAAETLSRFFTLHVFVIPGLLIAFVGLHLFLVLKLGINEWPMPGRLVSRETYRRDYEALVERDGVPFFPDAAQARPGLRGGHDRGDPGVRGALRSVRSERRARSDHHPDHAAPGLLLPVAVLRLRAASAVHRDRPHAHGARHRHPAALRGAVHRGDRREELEAPPDRGARGHR